MNILHERCKHILYDDETEKRIHLGAIAALSVRADHSVEKVERLYEIVLNRFKREAKIRDYLPILVSRRVHYLLDKRKPAKKPDVLVRNPEPR